MHTLRRKSRGFRAVVIAVCILAGIGAAMFLAMNGKGQSKDRLDGYLPKDVPQTPAASPLATAPPETALRSDAVTIDLPKNASVGPDTTVTGTADSTDGTVYYRISDYRRGQIAAGETKAPPGNLQPFSFRPQFSRVYTNGDPATLDVYVLGPDGAEQTTRTSIKLK